MRTVPSGGSLEEGVDIGRQGLGDYSYVVTFDDHGATASGAFTVE